MDWERVLRNLIGLMQSAEGMKADGTKKKDFVLQRLFTIFDLDKEQRLIMIFLVDLIIQLDKNQLRIATKKCFSCIG